jgi:hypothetical protein
VVSFTPRSLYLWGKPHGIHWIGDWVDPRASLDDVEKRDFLTLPGLGLRHLGLPSRSQSLYRLSYPGSFSALYFSFNSFTTSIFLKYLAPSDDPVYILRPRYVLHACPFPLQNIVLTTQRVRITYTVMGRQVVV